MRALGRRTQCSRVVHPGGLGTLVCHCTHSATLPSLLRTTGTTSTRCGHAAGKLRGRWRARRHCIVRWVSVCVSVHDARRDLLLRQPGRGAAGPGGAGDGRREGSTSADDAATPPVCTVCRLYRTSAFPGTVPAAVNERRRAERRAKGRSERRAEGRSKRRALAEGCGERLLPAARRAAAAGGHQRRRAGPGARLRPGRMHTRTLPPRQAEVRVRSSARRRPSRRPAPRATRLDRLVSLQRSRERRENTCSC